MPVVDPPPYPEGVAPFGGQPIDFHRYLRIWGRRMVRRWEFTSGDPHHMHHQHLEELPQGWYGLNATATRETRVWVFRTQTEAEQAAERMRAAVRWPGQWAEISSE